MSEGNPQRPMQAPSRVRPPANPSAAAYQRTQQQRGVGGGPPKTNMPRAGGPPVPIPPLDGPPGDGRTMSQMAMDQRRPPQMPGSILQPAQPKPGPTGNLDIRPTDLLPDEAKSDPDFMHGSGSMYAFNQPHLAQKYGVIRNQQRIAPQQLPRRAPGSDPSKPQPRRPVEETAADLRKLEELRTKVDTGEYDAEKASEEGPAGAAAKIGAPPSATTDEDGAAPKLSDEEIKKRVAGMDEFDLSTLHEMMVRDIINNAEQRKIVEERLEPLNLADLVVNYTVTQVVPIIPGVFEPEFESLTGEDDLELKRMLVEEAKTLKVDDTYLLNKYALYGLTCAVKAVNKKPLGSHRDKDGNFSEDLLLQKFKRLLKMPLPMLATLGPHYFWFDMRVRKLFVAVSIKNG